jgi:hypothetical protein
VDIAKMFSKKFFAKIGFWVEKHGFCKNPIGFLQSLLQKSTFLQKIGIFARSTFLQKLAFLQKSNFAKIGVLQKLAFL